MKKVTLGLFSVLFVLSLTVAQPVAGQKAATPMFGADRDLLVSPQTLLLDWNAQNDFMEITIHADINFNSVRSSTVTLDEIEAVRTFADNRGDLVAKFAWDDIREYLEGIYGSEPEGGSVTMTLTLNCDLVIGTFTGSDDVKVMF